MSASALLSIGLAVEAVLLLLVLFSALRAGVARNQLLSALAAGSAADPPDLAAALTAVEALPEPYRSAGARLHEAMAGAKTLDEATLEALRHVAVAPPRPGLFGTMVFDAALVAAACAPCAWALAGAARRVAELAASVSSLEGPRRYAASIEAIPAAFEGLREGFLASAVLLAAGAIVFAFRWWLLRPEVIEAKDVECVMGASQVAAPDAGAPGAAKLAAVLAPDLSLWPAFRGAVAFLLLVTAAWSILTLAADARTANQTPLAYGRWTPEVVSASAGEDLSVPSYPAGVPLGSAADPSLIVRLDSVRVADAPLTTLTAGRTQVGWTALARSLTRTLEGFRREGKPPAVRVLAHPDLPMSTLVEVMEHLRLSYQITRFNLVVERHPPEHPKGASRVQAALRLEVPSPSALPTTTLGLRVGRAEVGLAAGATRTVTASISSIEPEWKRRVATIVREKTGLLHALEGPVDARVPVATRPDVPYERFVEVLAAADTACPGSADCGLPGLGLSFVLVP